MAQIIGLPKLSPTMEEGVLVRWVKKEGDAVEPGDLIAEVETDKANMDFTLEDEGVLLKLLVGEGETVKLGAPVAILGNAGENVDALVKQAASGGEPPATEPSRRFPEETIPTPAAPVAAAPSAGVEAAPPPAPRPSGRLLASPLAKSLAIELGIDLRQVTGSGPGGRIIERDVRRAGDTAAPAPEPPPRAKVGTDSTALAVVPRHALALPGESDEYMDKPLSNMRKTIASRLTAAKRDVPHFRITSSVDTAKLIEFRRRLNLLLGDRGRVTVNDLIIKGAALALRRVPEVNAAFVGDAIRYFTRVHIGVAVALDEGLTTPVVRNADLKGIGVIGNEVRSLVARAKDRQLKAHEITGSTFTLSNLGMFPVDHFDAIINPPEAAILAVGRSTKQPVVVDDEIRIGQRMSFTLSCDHRVVDGALGARYLSELVDLLENPESLAL